MGVANHLISGLETRPKLNPELLVAVHSLIINNNIHPVKVRER